MADAEKINEVMNKAWDETIGSDKGSLPDEKHHLNPEAPDHFPDETKAASPAEAVVEELKEDPVDQVEATDEKKEEPVKEEAATQETGPDELPGRWSEDDRKMFAKVPAATRDWLIGRHKQMEADYTRKTQENAETIKVGNTVADLIPVDVRAQIKAEGATNEQFIAAVMTNFNLSRTDPVTFIKQVAANSGIDLATLVDKQKPAEGAKQTPADQRLAALEARIAKDDEARQNAIKTSAKTRVELFREAKADDGTPKYPHYERLRVKMAQIMVVDKDATMESAYDAAQYMDPEIRSSLLAKPVTQPKPAPTTAEVKQAQKAAAVNIKGNGVLVDKAKSERKMTLRETLEETASEIGMS